MQIRTATISLNAPKDLVFDYLAEPRNHAEWATEFIRGMEERDGVLWANTSKGNMRYRVQADRATGVIDILVAPPGGPEALFPTRVVEFVPGASVFAFTVMQGPAMADAEFESDFRSLTKELQNLRHRFEAP